MEVKANQNFHVLKNFKELGDTEISTITHELWHAYFDGISKQTEFYQEFMKNAMTLYAGNARNVQGDVQNEAYGLFIDHVLFQFLTIRKQFELRTPENREKLRRSEEMKKLYQDVLFRDEITGYYQDQETCAIVPSGVNLPVVDRKNILENLFKNKISTLESAFSEEYF